MKIIKNILSLLNAICISVTICLALDFLFFVHRGGEKFYLVTPYEHFLDYRMGQYPQLAHALIAFSFYITVGIFFWTLLKIFEKQKFGFTLINFAHLFLSVIAFSMFNYLAPIRLLTHVDYFNMDDFPHGIWGFYAQLPPAVTIPVFLIPLLYILAVYVLSWLIFYFFNCYQIKKINQKISVSADRNNLDEI